MKSLATSLLVLILAVSVAAATLPILPEKKGIVSNIEAICNSDAPETQPLRDNAAEMLPILRANILKSRAFSMNEKTEHIAGIDNCVIGMKSKAETKGQLSTANAASSVPPASVFGQKISSICNIGLVSFTHEEWDAVRNDPVRYSRFLSDFNRLSRNRCFATPTPNAAE